MTNFYKYLPVSEEDELWGLHVLNGGCNIIGKNTSYPSRDHPAHHYFSWNKGTGIPPNQYHLQLKIEKAKLLLAEPSQSIKEIGLTLNFESPSHFSKLFNNKTGLSPEQFRQNINRHSFEDFN